MQFLNRDLVDAHIIGLGITDSSKPFYIGFLYYYDKIPDFFKLAYNIILNKDRGPRLASLILAQPNKINNLLNQIK